MASLASRTFHPCQKLQYLLILDFEPTFREAIPKHKHEIIKFPMLLCNIKEKKVGDDISRICLTCAVAGAGWVLHKIDWSHKLVCFCWHEWIFNQWFAQEVVSGADTFPGVWLCFNKFLRLHGVFNDLCFWCVVMRICKSEHYWLSRFLQHDLRNSRCVMWSLDLHVVSHIQWSPPCEPFSHSFLFTDLTGHTSHTGKYKISAVLKTNLKL